MAQQLWFLRHGEAEPHGTRPDHARRLTPRGEEQARAAGRGLAALGVSFQLVATSPKLRARDTAVLACTALGGEPIEYDTLALDFDLDDALELAHAAGDDKRVLVVGHNPDFELVIADLTGARVDMKKGGVAGVRMEGGHGELLVLLRPRELARLA